MKIKHKEYALELKNSDLNEDGTTSFTAYASVFGNVDAHGDMVMAGAFTESLKTIAPKLLYQHQFDNVVGVIDTVVEDTKGLFITGRVANTAMGKDVSVLLKMGAIKGVSIGYSTKDYSMVGEVRQLKAVDLYECSFVTFPANRLAEVTAVKKLNKSEMPKTIREFEKILRDVGFSKDAAKSIAAKGFIEPRRDAEDNSLGQLLESINKSIKEAQNAT